MNSANFLATQTSFHNSYGISAQNPFDTPKTPQQHINNSSHQMLSETSSDTNLNQSSTNIPLKTPQESSVILNHQRASKTSSPHITISNSSEHFPLEKLTQSNQLQSSSPITDLTHKSKSREQELMTAQLADHFQGSNPKVRNDHNSHNISKTALKIPASLASLSPNSNKKPSQSNTPSIKVTQSADDHEFTMQEEIVAKMRPRRESSAGLLSTETLLKCKNETLQVQDLASMSMDEHGDSASDMDDTRSERSYKASRRGEPYKKKVRVCFNGLCITDPSDATLWCRQKVRKSNICKQCFEAYKKEQYCYFCYQIYIDNDTSAYSDGKEWIACDACARWHHVDCETEHGLKDVKQLLEEDTTFKYKCPPCRMPEQAEDTPPHKAKKGPRGNMHGKRGGHHHDTEVRIKSQLMTEITNRDAYEGDHEEMIIKKAKLLSETSEEGFMTVPIMPNNLADMQREMKKKKLDSVINKSILNKKKLQQKVFAPLELHHGIEHLLTQYAGKRLQLSDSEIRADLSLFRELSGSTCPTEEKSNSSDGLGLDYLSTMWEEKTKSSEVLEEKLLKRKDPKKKLQFKIVRSPGKFSLSRLQLSEEKFANRRQLRSHARTAQNVP